MTAIDEALAGRYSQLGAMVPVWIDRGESTITDQPMRRRRPLTYLRVEERCEGCPWPDVCAGDVTCWIAERDAAVSAMREGRGEDGPPDP